MLPRTQPGISLSNLSCNHTLESHVTQIIVQMASIGVGDFIAVGKIAKTVIEACKDGPGELQELGREVKTLEVTMDRLSQDVDDPQSTLNRRGANRRQDLQQLIDNCKIALLDVQNFVEKHSTLERPSNPRNPFASTKRTWHRYQVGSTDIDDMRGKLTFYTSSIGLYLDSLTSAAISRMERKIDQILINAVNSDRRASTSSLQSMNSVVSLASVGSDDQAWDRLRVQLVEAGVSYRDINDNRDRIIVHVRNLLASHHDPAPSLNGNGKLLRLAHLNVCTDKRLKRSEPSTRIPLETSIPLTYPSTGSCPVHCLKGTTSLTFLHGYWEAANSLSRQSLCNMEL